MVLDALMGLQVIERTKGSFFRTSVLSAAVAK